jgi:hypothetical protein
MLNHFYTNPYYNCVLVLNSLKIELRTKNRFFDIVIMIVVVG